MQARKPASLSPAGPEWRTKAEEPEQEESVCEVGME
jgi:hypothetical protein